MSSCRHSCTVCLQQWKSVQCFDLAESIFNSKISTFTISTSRLAFLEEFEMRRRTSYRALNT